MGELNRKHFVRVCLIRGEGELDGPRYGVMDDHAVRWGQESWGSWFGSFYTPLLPF